MLSQDEEHQLKKKLNSLKEKQKKVYTDTNSQKKNSTYTENKEDEIKHPIHIGFEFCFTICVFLGIGYFLDNKWNTEPWLFLCGFIVGFIVALYRIIQYTK